MVGIVYIQDIRFCPYLERYTSILRKKGISFDLIWWERWDTPSASPLPESCEGARERHVFQMPSNMRKSPIRKLGDFIAFSRFASAIIRREHYDKLIVLTTMSGVLLCDILAKTYKGRYIFDIRDYSYEKFKAFRAIEGRLVRDSSFTCVSSEGFFEFLPKSDKYVLADNYLESDIKAAEGMAFHKKAADEPIVLSYVGFIRYFEQTGRIIDKLIDDPRFKLCYHGTGADYGKLLAYLDKKHADNLTVTGYYDNERDKRALYEKADIINNFYPRTLEIQRLASTNKTYDGMIFRRPQVVSSGTFSQVLMDRWGIGCALDIAQPDFADRLFGYYSGIDEDVFNERCLSALESVRERNDAYTDRIERFLNAS